MVVLLIMFVVLVLLRLLLEQKYRPRNLQSIGVAARDEASAFFLAAVALVGIFALLYVFVLFFGPIPQIHEW